MHTICRQLPSLESPLQFSYFNLTIFFQDVSKRSLLARVKLFPAKKLLVADYVWFLTGPIGEISFPTLIIALVFPIYHWKDNFTRCQQPVGNEISRSSQLSSSSKRAMVEIFAFLMLFTSRSRLKYPPTAAMTRDHFSCTQVEYIQGV